MDLTEFLLARIAEDEDAIGYWLPNEARRWKAECETKRRILARACVREGEHAPGAEAMRLTLKDLALPYADHPDYRQEWKP